jgi:hypothetical protein
MIGAILGSIGSAVGGAASAAGSLAGSAAGLAGSAIGGLGQIAGSGLSWAAANSGAIADLAGTGFGVYQGIRSMDQAEDAAELQYKAARLNAGVRSQEAAAMAQAARAGTVGGGTQVVPVNAGDPGGQAAGLDTTTLLLIGLLVFLILRKGS